MLHDVNAKKCSYITPVDDAVTHQNSNNKKFSISPSNINCCETNIQCNATVVCGHGIVQ